MTREEQARARAFLEQRGSLETARLGLRVLEALGAAEAKLAEAESAAKTLAGYRADLAVRVDALEAERELEARFDCRRGPGWSSDESPCGRCVTCLTRAAAELREKTLAARVEALERELVEARRYPAQCTWQPTTLPEARQVRHMRPLLIGEANPYSGDPGHALLPWPRGASGDRLREILGLTDREYLQRFDRRNLVAGNRWSLSLAWAAVDQLLDDNPADRSLVLLGRRVATAFDLPGPFFARGLHVTGAGRPFWFYLLPHPSGLCHAWNDPAAAGRARALLGEFLP